MRQGNAKPVILVLTGGCPVAIPEVHELADVIFGAAQPVEATSTVR